jgi:hypothetical protein
MSANICGPEIVNLILSAANDRHVESALREAYKGDPDMTDTDAARSTLGRYLICMNVRSVQYRYNGESLDTLPGYMFEFQEGTHFHPLPVYEFTRERLTTRDHGFSLSMATACRVLGAIADYEYQSCELPEYFESPACGFMVDVMRTCATSAARAWESSNLSTVSA